jgi:Fe-S cluster assembly protein SufD
MKVELVKVDENKSLSAVEDTQYVLWFPNKMDSTEYTVEVSFEKPGVTAEIIGAYKLNEGESLNLITIANHKVPNTGCTTKIKGVLMDNTNASYIGKIIIAKPAQQTSSFLEDAILVLGNNTKNRSDPILEIEADDVAASHGATTGRIDKDQIYYLQSRGLSSEEAETIIVEGFFESLISSIQDTEVQKNVRSLV